VWNPTLKGLVGVEVEEEGERCRREESGSVGREGNEVS
jgi:hypothetical protein